MDVFWGPEATRDWIRENCFEVDYGFADPVENATRYDGGSTVLLDFDHKLLVVSEDRDDYSPLLKPVYMSFLKSMWPGWTILQAEIEEERVHQHIAGSHLFKTIESNWNRDIDLPNSCFNQSPEDRPCQADADSSKASCSFFAGQMLYSGNVELRSIDDSCWYAIDSSTRKMSQEALALFNCERFRNCWSGMRTTFEWATLVRESGVRQDFAIPSHCYQESPFLAFLLLDGEEVIDRLSNVDGGDPPDHSSCHAGVIINESTKTIRLWENDHLFGEHPFDRLPEIWTGWKIERVNRFHGYELQLPEDQKNESDTFSLETRVRMFLTSIVGPSLLSPEEYWQTLTHGYLGREDLSLEEAAKWHEERMSEWQNKGCIEPAKLSRLIDAIKDFNDDGLASIESKLRSIIGETS